MFRRNTAYEQVVLLKYYVLYEDRYIKNSTRQYIAAGGVIK